MSSLTAPILAKVAKCLSSAAARQVLECTFASKTESNILHIKRELQHIKKGNLPMSDFLDNAKQLADSLAAAGHQISDMELRHCILDGLDSSYESVYATLTATMSSWSIEDFESYLITYERHLDTVNKSLLSQPQAHVAKSSSSRSHEHSATANENPIIICQLCDKPYHSCQDCFKRFDKTFKPPRKQPPKKKGSRSPNESSATPAAYATRSNSVYTYDWLPDSGASNHMTHSITNLQNQTEYTGPEQVRVANGYNMPISHTGSSVLPTPNRKFLLSNVLCVPHLDRNLLSVSRFCQDNNVSFEFFDIGCVVKDRQTGRPVLRGTLKDGLYSLLPTSSPIAALVGERTSLQSWHHRLGHPMLRTVKTVVSRNQLPVSNSKFSFCQSCLENKSHKLPFNSSTTVYANPLDLIVSDVWGPSPGFI